MLTINRTEVSRLGTDRSSGNRRKSRLKERSLASKLRRSQMPKVVYRGVEYDTNDRPNQDMRLPAHVEIYRGVMFYVDDTGKKTTMLRSK